MCVLVDDYQPPFEAAELDASLSSTKFDIQNSKFKIQNSKFKKPVDRNCPQKGKGKTGGGGGVVVVGILFLECGHHER